jgi:hypothetical protein
MTRIVRPELAPGTVVRIKRGYYTILGTEPGTTRAGSRIYSARIEGTDRTTTLSEASVTVISEPSK